MDNRKRIVTDLVWARLLAILEDQAQTLIRTAFSATTRESGDLSAGLFDRRARMVAQAVTGTPGHVNSMALAVAHFLERFPLDSLSPGDVLASNDPWICSGHLHDFTVVTPIFHSGRGVGAVANTIHVVDIGGLGFGTDAREVFEEGLCIPPVRLAQAGELDPMVVQVIRANVREPDQVIGDLHSSIAGNARAAGRVAALLQEFALADFEEMADAIIERTRKTVEERIGALPDGVYRNVLKADGYDGEIDLPIAVTIDGRTIVLDFEGASPAAARGINVALNYTTAYAVFGINCVLNPDIPCNHGSLDPIHVVAPMGSILNAQRPAAVSARHMIGHMLPDLVLGALAEILPVPAEGAGLIWNPSLRGRMEDGSPFAVVTFNAGGAGAQHDRDGWNTTAFPSGVKTMPVEAVEATAPIVVLQKALRTDSGGAGRQRGGLGQRIEIECAVPLLANAMFDRIVHAPKGREGGSEGGRGAASLRSGRPFASKGLQEIEGGDALILDLPGGAGFGPAEERDGEAVRRDVVEGYISPEAARNLYGRDPDA